MVCRQKFLVEFPAFASATVRIGQIVIRIHQRAVRHLAVSERICCPSVVRIAKLLVQIVEPRSVTDWQLICVVFGWWGYWRTRVAFVSKPCWRRASQRLGTLVVRFRI